MFIGFLAAFVPSKSASALLHSGLLSASGASAGFPLGFSTSPPSRALKPFFVSIFSMAVMVFSCRGCQIWSSGMPPATRASAAFASSVYFLTLRPSTSFHPGHFRPFRASSSAYFSTESSQARMPAASSSTATVSSAVISPGPPSPSASGATPAKSFRAASMLRCASARHCAFARQNRHHAPGSGSPSPLKAIAALGLSSSPPQRRRSSASMPHSDTFPMRGWKMLILTRRMS